MPIQTQFPTAFRKSYLKRYLVDRFIHSVSAPLPSTTSASPGPGTFNKYADSGETFSIENKEFVVSSISSILDPAGYWTKSNGDGFSQTAGMALVLYPRHAPILGWSKDTTLTDENLIYGVSGRDIRIAGNVWDEVGSNSADDVWIIVFSETDAQFFIRRGPIVKLVFTWPLESVSSLYPTILGKVGELESIYLYNTEPAEPLVSITNPTAGTEFTHPTTEFMMEFDVTAFGGSFATNIDIYRQDDDNRIFVSIGPNGQMSLYRRESGTNTLVSRMSDTGDVKAGSKIKIHFKPDAMMGSSSGSGKSFKVWVDGKPRYSTGTMPFASLTSGKIFEVAAGIPIANFRIWNMQYE